MFLSFSLQKTKQTKNKKRIHLDISIFLRDFERQGWNVVLVHEHVLVQRRWQLRIASDHTGEGGRDRREVSRVAVLDLLGDGVARRLVARQSELWNRFDDSVGDKVPDNELEFADSDAVGNLGADDVARHNSCWSWIDLSGEKNRKKIILKFLSF